MPDTKPNPHAPAAGGEGNGDAQGGDAGNKGGKPQAGGGQGDGSNDGGDGGEEGDPSGDGSGDGSGGGDDGLTPEAKAKINKANREAAQLRKRLKEAEEKNKAHEDAGKSEADKAKEKATQAEQTAAKLKERLLNKSIEAAAAKHEAHDGATVAKLIDRDAIEYDDDGEPTNLDDLFKELKTASPFLFKGKAPVTPPINPGKPDSGGQNKGALTLDAINKMSADEINKNWDAIQALMKEGKLNRK